jgi:Fur family ferric uptake transcriptional regulator
LICLNCKQIFSFEDDLLEQLEAEIYEKNGFSVTDHDVKLYGYCKSCQTKKNDSLDFA